MTLLIVDGTEFNGQFAKIQIDLGQLVI